jgi:thiol-disulfide isomerase/thioredoxin
MTAGLIVCAAALAVAIAAGLTWRRRNGRMRPVPGGRPIAGQAAVAEGSAGEAADGNAATGRPTAEQAATGQAAPERAATGQAAAGQAAAGQETAGQETAGQAVADHPGVGRPAAGRAPRRLPRSRVTSSGPDITDAELGGPLGSRATLLQFSSAFCAPCRATRRVLAEVAGMTDGVAHLEIDAESHLDLVRRLDVRRTPTVFVLGPDGRIAHRASGQPRKADVIAALGEVT